MSDANARHAEKIRARAEGTAPVIVQAPELQPGNGPESIEARYQAKLRSRTAPAADKAKPADKPDEGKGGESKQPAQQPKGDKKADKPDEGKGSAKNDSGKSDQPKG